MNGLRILNVGEGDLTLTFDATKPEELERAKVTVTEMLRMASPSSSVWESVTVRQPTGALLDSIQTTTSTSFAMPPSAPESNSQAAKTKKVDEDAPCPRFGDVGRWCVALRGRHV